MHIETLQRKIKTLSIENQNLKKELARYRPEELITEPCVCRTREGKVIYVIAFKKEGMEEKWLSDELVYYSNGRYVMNQKRQVDIVEIIRPLTEDEMIEYCRTGSIDLGDVE